MPEARTVLAFMQRAAAREVEKVLRSAVANAESNPNLHWDGDELVVSAAYVDEGPTLKRWRAARAAASTRSSSAPATSRSRSSSPKARRAEGQARGHRRDAEARASAPKAAGSAAKPKTPPKKKEVAA